MREVLAVRGYGLAAADEDDKVHWLLWCYGRLDGGARAGVCEVWYVHPEVVDPEEVGGRHGQHRDAHQLGERDA